MYTARVRSFSSSSLRYFLTSLRWKVQSHPPLASPLEAATRSYIQYGRTFLSTCSLGTSSTSSVCSLSLYTTPSSPGFRGRQSGRPSGCHSCAAPLRPSLTYQMAPSAPSFLVPAAKAAGGRLGGASVEPAV